MSTIKKVDRFSEYVHNALTPTLGYSVEFKKRLRNQIIPLNTEIRLLRYIYSYISDRAGDPTKARSKMSIKEIYIEQLKLSSLSASQVTIKKTFVQILKNMETTSGLNVSHLFFSISPYIKEKSCKLVFDSFRDIILNPPEECSKMRIGVKMLELLFSIRTGALLRLARKSSYGGLINSEGAPCLYLANAGNLVRRHNVAKLKQGA